MTHARNLRKVNRILRVHFRQQKASVIGPDLSHRRTLVDGLIHTPKIQQAIAAEAAAQEITLIEAEARARSYANEIASDYSMSVLRFLDIVLTWFWNKLYSGVKISHIEGLKEISKTHTVVYVPCHRSHIGLSSAVVCSVLRRITTTPCCRRHKPEYACGRYYSA